MDNKRYTVQPGIPQAPVHSVPSASCDCHGHIFPSREQYPTVNETMPFAPIEMYLAVHEKMGVNRGVLVQGGAYRHDNSAMLAALARFPDRLRGVALVAADISDAALESMRQSGVCALRFTNGGASRVSDLRALAPRMKALGFHAELFLGTKVFADLAPELLALGVPLVLDHLGGPFDASAGIDELGFQILLNALRDQDIWIKLSPQRNSKAFPSYQDVRPFYDQILAVRPDRLVWGSDWPFPNMSDRTPDPSFLLDLAFEWIADKELRKAIFVENPARLYRF